MIWSKLIGSQWNYLQSFIGKHTKVFQAIVRGVYILRLYFQFSLFRRLPLAQGPRLSMQLQTVFRSLARSSCKLSEYTFTRASISQSVNICCNSTCPSFCKHACVKWKVLAGRLATCCFFFQEMEGWMEIEAGTKK